MGGLDKLGLQLAGQQAVVDVVQNLVHLLEHDEALPGQWVGSAQLWHQELRLQDQTVHDKLFYRQHATYFVILMAYLATCFGYVNTSQVLQSVVSWLRFKATCSFGAMSDSGCAANVTC